MRPSVYSVLRVDFPAFTASIFAPVCLVMAGASWMEWLPASKNDTPAGAASFFLSLAAVALVVAIPVIAWRVRRTWRAFDGGRKVPGEIVSVWGGRGRAWITFRYDLDGTPVETSSYVMLGKRASALSQGSAITVAVDASHPRDAVIADLFAA